VNEEAKSTPRRVLVVDDDPTIVLLLEHVLEGLGWTYDTAADGEEAWEMWQKDKHPLLVLDLEMPKMDGFEVCRLIRKAQPTRETYVLVVTGRDKAADLEAVLAAGADDYITKPTSGQRLTARLRIAERRMDNDVQRRQVEEMLRQSQWLAGIGEATVGLQHEINNPLTGLLGTAELMLMDAKDAGRPTEDIEMILQQARRIGELVKRLGELRDPKSVHYREGSPAKMLDLGKSKKS
jgi:DNA-binding response OmpR family regulator